MRKSSRKSTAWDLEAGQTPEEESDTSWSRRPTTAPAGDYPEYKTKRGSENRPREFDRGSSSRSIKITEEAFEVSDGSERENTPVRSIRSPVSNGTENDYQVTQVQRPIPRPRKDSNIKIDRERQRDRDRPVDSHSDLEHDDLARSRYTEGRSDRKNRLAHDQDSRDLESRRDTKVRSDRKPQRDPVLPDIPKRSLDRERRSTAKLDRDPEHEKEEDGRLDKGRHRDIDEGRGTKQIHRDRRDQRRHSDSSDTGSSREGSIKSNAESDAESQDVKEILKTTAAQILLGDVGNDSEDLNQLKETYWSALFFKPPAQRTPEEWEEWANLTYTPSSVPVPLLEKLGEETRPRYAQDEGLFVGDPVPLSTANKNRLERRMVRENSLSWFGQNGELQMLPNPYRNENVQFFYDQEVQDEYEEKHLRFVPARLDPFQAIQLDPHMNYEVVIDLGSITFTHHALFSKEHLLASRLDLLFTEYSNRQEENLRERAENKLVALRQALSHAKIARQELNDRHKAGEDLTPDELDTLKQLRDRIGRYGQEMRRARLERDQSLWDDRATLASVLHAWKELKQLRAEQEYTSTLLKLNIITLQQEFGADKETWLSEIEEEFEDLKAEHEEDYEEAMRQYNADMKIWLNLRRQAKNQKAERPYSASHGHGEGQSQETVSSGEDSVKSGDSRGSFQNKPLPPPQFEPDKLREDISKRFHELKRLPGEPKLVLELVRTATVTTTVQLPKGSTGEERRRRAVTGTRVEVRIALNRKEIFRTRAQQLTNEFSVFYGLTIPICLREWPETVALEIFENGKRHIGSIPVQFPNSKTTIDRSLLKRLSFGTDEVMKVSHAGVGSGVDFEISGQEYTGIYSSGIATIGWSVDKDKNVLCPKGFEKVHRDLNERQASGDSKHLHDLNEIDPNDPLNVKRRMDLRSKTQSHTKGNSAQWNEQKSAQFSLDQGMEEFEFCSDDYIRQSRRLRLLYLRSEEVPEFRSLRMIPVHEDQIPLDIFVAYENRLAEDQGKRFGVTEARKNRKRILDDESRDDTDRLDRIREMRLSVLKLFENSLKQITFEDLVVEEQIPDIGTLGLNLMTMFQPKRPLRPARKERKRIQGTTLIDTKIDIIINIVRAFNVPLRKETEVGVLTTESMTGIPIIKKRGVTVSNPSTVKPFVEIWFQRNVCRTTTALGGNPTWNQELQLPLTAENEDYSQGNLSRMDDLVYLHVYDEVGIDLLEDERRRETDIHQRLEKRWLGSITIPFSTLYNNGRIEGTFKLNSPPILLGYEAQGIVGQLGPAILNRGPPTNLNLTKAGTSPLQSTNQKNTFLTMFITLQPSLTPSSALKEDCATGETLEMTNHVKSWQNSIHARFPSRIIKPFVMSPDGDTVLCMRYLKPIAPPTSLLLEDNSLIQTMEEVAHYVSLFPSVRDATLGIFDYSLWFTSDVFVMTPGGGVEDHAVLLACFFLHLEVPTWILQGNAIPNGPTTYVVTSFRRMISESRVSKEMKNAVLIWNPTSGEYFEAHDTFCSLDKVWAAIGKYNIWANISGYERPDQMDWDIEKSSQWTPLFSKPLAEGKLPSLQGGTIRYKDADQVQANSLAQRIERHLKDAFMKWRKSTKTHWNRHCTAILRRLLPKLEERKMTGRNGSESGHTDHESHTTILSSSPTAIYDEHFMELREITNAYQMTGFPLQQAYINLESVTETIFATGVHTIDTPDVEFALAAFAQSYPASVYSLWIYIAALHRHK